MQVRRQVVVSGENDDVLAAAPIGDAGRRHLQFGGAERRVSSTKVRPRGVDSHEERRVTARVPWQRDEQKPSI